MAMEVPAELLFQRGIQKLMPFKLAITSNFELWKLTLLNLLKQNNLYHVLGYHDEEEEEEEEEEGGERVITEEEDQLVLGIIHSNVTPSVLSHLADSSTSIAAWAKLQQKFSNLKHFKILCLESKLQSLKMDYSRPTVEHLVSEIETICGNLKSLGYQVVDSNIMADVLPNLSSHYQSEFKISQPKPMSLPEFYEMLQRVETSLKKQSERPSYFN